MIKHVGLGQTHSNDLTPQLSLLLLHQISNPLFTKLKGNSHPAKMDVNMFTTPYQLTKSMHRDVYPPVDPSNPDLSAKGKVVIVTGAGGGLGAVSCPR